MVDEASLKVKSIDAYTVFDSRGYPTIECICELDNGASGKSIVPSGASTGTFEALELRDGDPQLFGGKSVHLAINHIKTSIQTAVLKSGVNNQERLDQLLIDLDGTANKSRFGANAILAVSMAYAHAVAQSKNLPLFESLNPDPSAHIIPLPEIQIFGGGAHSAGRIDLQDFMVICTGAENLMQCYQMTFDVYQAAGQLMKERGQMAGLADEGGYWPTFDSNTEVFVILEESILRAGYIPGKDISISLDIAATEFYTDGKYHLKLEDRYLSATQFAQVLDDWINKYAVCSIEDPFSEVDHIAWSTFTEKWGDKLQLIGDDLFVTNQRLLQQGIKQKLANSILIKLNQIGTVTETLQCIHLAQEAGWRPVISARSGETEDTFISHLAVATGAGQLKVGSFARSERMVKWNELLRIQRKISQSGQNPSFAVQTIRFPWDI
ncbi:MAG: phosphopyruvate hydratase [Saprospiraceae bacterium]|nr:phosphopyruvate hydratase [Saprospiraceae bacterium]